MVSSGGEGEVAIGLGEVGGMVYLSCVGEVGLCIHSASGIMHTLCILVMEQVPKNLHFHLLVQTLQQN